MQSTTDSLPAVGSFVNNCSGETAPTFSPKSSIVDDLKNYGLHGASTINSLEVTAIAGNMFLLGMNEQDSNYNTSPEKIVEIDNHCKLIKSFGVNGSLIPVMPGVQKTVAISNVGATTYTGETYSIFQKPLGGFFVASSTNSSMIIGSYNSAGKVQKTFGDQGWVTLSPPMAQDQSCPFVTKILTASNGNIYIYGSNGCTHADVQPIIFKLNSDGSQIFSFGGGRGYVALFTPFVEPDGIIIQPNGNLVAFGSMWGGGAGNDIVEWVSPSGVIQSSINATYVSSRPISSIFAYDGFVFNDKYGGPGVIGVNFENSNSVGVDNISIQLFDSDGHLRTQKSSLQTVLNLSGGDQYNDIQGLVPLKNGDYLVADAGGFQLLNKNLNLKKFGTGNKLVMGNGGDNSSMSSASPIRWDVNSVGLIGATMSSGAGFIFQLARA